MIEDTRLDVEANGGNPIDSSMQSMADGLMPRILGLDERQLNQQVDILSDRQAESNNGTTGIDTDEDINSSQVDTPQQESKVQGVDITSLNLDAVSALDLSLKEEEEEDQEQFVIDYTDDPVSVVKKTYSPVVGANILSRRVSPLFLDDEESALNLPTQEEIQQFGLAQGMKGIDASNNHKHSLKGKERATSSTVSSIKRDLKIHGPYSRSTEACDELLLSSPVNCDSSSCHGSSRAHDSSRVPISSSLPNTSCIPVSLGTPSVATNPRWKRYGDLKINIDLFNKGILIVEPCGYLMSTALDSPTLSYSVDNSDFTTSLRKMCLNQKAEIMPQVCDGSSFSVSSRKLFFSNKAEIIAHGGKTASALKKTISLLDKLKEYANDGHISEEGKDFIIANSIRREEVFFPFIIQNQPQNFGFYFYPWLSSNNSSNQSFSFSGFKRFVTVGCMFGSTLKGIDQYGARLDLIKHDIKFHPLQKIMTIEYSHSSNAYEEVMFNELEKLMLLMNNLSGKNDAIELYYHLPFYDYMLFGIELFIRGRMQILALENFFKAIILKTIDHVKKIKAISEKHSILCKIRSPFENLFGRLPLPFDQIAEIIGSTNSEAVNIVQMILPMLGESIRDSNPELDDNQQKLQEKRLVKHCLKKLLENNINPRHKKVWNDYISFIKEDAVNNLDDLFKVANAIVILLASQGEADHKVCSILPFSEKQIQVSYASFCGKSSGDYPVVINLTTTDPVIAYDHNRKGLLFYFGGCQDSLSKLIKQDILSYAHQNVALTARNRENISIERLLDNLERCKPNIA